jgi:hypothetical protein
MPTPFSAIVRSTYKTIATSMSFAIVAALSLVTISIALVVAAANPTMNGLAIAAVAGLLIVALAMVVTILSRLSESFRMIPANDDLVYW